MTTKSINDRLGDGGFESVAVFNETEAGGVDGLISPEGSALKIPFLISQSGVSVTRTGQNSIIDPNDDTDYVVLATITVPGGTMGINSSLRITVDWGYQSSAIVKTLAIDWGGNNISGPTFSSSKSAKIYIEIMNVGSLSSQKTLNASTYTSSAGDHVSTTVNTADDVDIDIKCRFSGATTETITLIGYSVWHYPGND